MRAVHARCAWAALILFIAYGSWGATTGVAHGWAPLTVSLPDLAQNVLLYLPFGILAALSVAGPPARPAAVAIAVCAAILVSFAIESVQLQMPDRTASFVDVMAAAAGSAMGALAANAATRSAARAAASAPPALMEGRSASLLMALVFAATGIAWWPFDVTLDVSTVAARVRGMRDAIWMDTTPLGLLILKAALFAAIAYLCCSPIRAQHRRALSIAALVVIGYAIAVDVGQGLMGSRPAGLATLCWQLTGIAGGVAIATLSRPAP